MEYLAFILFVFLVWILSLNCDSYDDDCDPWTDPSCPDYWIYGPGADNDKNDNEF